MGDGPHLVEFCSTTEAASPRQVCDAMTVTIYTTSSTSSSNTAVGEVETWSGAVYVTSRRFVYGTLIIAPGTKVFFENDGGFVADGGTLLIGQLGAARVKVVGINATPGQRDAIATSQGACLFPNQLSTVVVESATFEGCRHAVSGNATFIDPSATYALRDVTFRHGVEAVVGMCPIMEDVVFEDFAEGIAETNRNGQGLCDDGRVYDGLTFDGVDNVAIAVSAANGAVAVRNSTFSDVGVAFGFSGTGDAAFDDGPVTIEHNVVVGAGVGVRTRDAERSPIVLRQNSFSDLDLAFELTGTVGGFDDEGDITLLGNRVDNVGRLIEIRYDRRGGSLLARGNTFVDYGTLLELDFPLGPDDWRESLLQANYLGDFDDPQQAAFEQVTGAVGRALPSSFTEDTWDNGGTNRIVRLDNPLDTPFVPAAPPLAVVAAPDQSYRYHKDLCVPLEAYPVVESFDAAGCVFETIDPDDPGAPRTLLTADADGCVTDPDVLLDGENWLEMTCDDGTRTTTHRVRFYAARDRLSGAIYRPDTTLTADVTLTSDLVVPFGHTLTVAPGVEVLVASNDERRARRADILGNGNDLSDWQLVDVRVEGALAFAGTQAQPITLRPADGLSGQGVWGDVFAIGPTSSLSYDHVRVEGARSVLSGVGGLTPVSHPQLEARFLDVQDAVVVAQRLCPAVFEDVTIDNVMSVLRLGIGNPNTAAWCPGPLTLARVSATGVTQKAIVVNVFAGEPNTIVNVVDSTFAFAIPAPLVSTSRLSVLLDGVTATNVERVVDFGGGIGGRALTVRDSLLDGFVELHFDSTSALDVDVTLDNSVFMNAAALIETGRTSTTVTNCRIENVATVFDMHHPNSGFTTSLVVTESSIDGAETVLQTEGGNITAAMSLTGNNITNTVSAVADVDSNHNDSVSVDLTGNHWGVATASEVEALIDDANPDASPVDEVVGLTDYSGWSATPLSLPNLP